MTKEVVALAEQAGMPVTDYGSGPFIDEGVTTQMLEKLATLVRNAAVIEERMALADLCDAMGSPNIAEYLRAQAEIIHKEPTT